MCTIDVGSHARSYPATGALFKYTPLHRHLVVVTIAGLLRRLAAVRRLAGIAPSSLRALWTVAVGGRVISSVLLLLLVRLVLLLVVLLVWLGTIAGLLTIRRGTTGRWRWVGLSVRLLRGRAVGVVVMRLALVWRRGVLIRRWSI